MALSSLGFIFLYIFTKDARARYAILKRHSMGVETTSDPARPKEQCRPAGILQRCQLTVRRLPQSGRDGPASALTGRHSTTGWPGGQPVVEIVLLRKEVIQPHLPVRLPCYDFVPVISPTLNSSLLAVGSPSSGLTNSHDVTGGVYKARERIHRSIADLRLLATPTSCRRVAACNPNYDWL